MNKDEVQHKYSSVDPPWKTQRLLGGERVESGYVRNDDAVQGQSGEVRTSSPVKARKPYTISKSRETWSEDEHARFLEAIELYHRDWKAIKSHVKTKDLHQIRSHAQKHFAKIEKLNTGEYIPPPRPKRRASKPYPRNLRPAESSRNSNLSSASSHSSAPAAQVTSSVTPEASVTPECNAAYVNAGAPGAACVVGGRPQQRHRMDEMVYSLYEQQLWQQQQQQVQQIEAANHMSMIGEGYGIVSRIPHSLLAYGRIQPSGNHQFYHSHSGDVHLHHGTYVHPAHIPYTAPHRLPTHVGTGGNQDPPVRINMLSDLGMAAGLDISPHHLAAKSGGCATGSSNHRAVMYGAATMGAANSMMEMFAGSNEPKRFHSDSAPAQQNECAWRHHLQHRTVYNNNQEPSTDPKSRNELKSVGAPGLQSNTSGAVCAKEGAQSEYATRSLQMKVDETASAPRIPSFFKPPKSPSAVSPLQSSNAPPHKVVVSLPMKSVESEPASSCEQEPISADDSQHAVVGLQQELAKNRVEFTRKGVQNTEANASKVPCVSGSPGVAVESGGCDQSSGSRERSVNDLGGSGNGNEQDEDLNNNSSDLPSSADIEVIMMRRPTKLKEGQHVEDRNQDCLEDNPSSDGSGGPSDEPRGQRKQRAVKSSKVEHEERNSGEDGCEETGSRELSPSGSNEGEGGGYQQGQQRPQAVQSESKPAKTRPRLDEVASSSCSAPASSSASPELVEPHSKSEGKRSLSAVGVEIENSRFEEVIGVVESLQQLKCDVKEKNLSAENVTTSISDGDRAIE
eukprot:CAMPEP_0182442488 /NCGR_PEP_ID=MMETSP1172-20130603/1401_1 /TAXON_ID=708627 /ORGANISM="Timspurckia oligopyrenoides, Strain CCMP3278" /LENGTH=791 /DNA_ID=CAMNT_0024637379 /DNA_START=39 /DNA_END=2414 /DNA_ORIENTATION=+